MPAGRPKCFESPKHLLEVFEAYRKECKANPIKKHIFVGKDGAPEWQFLERPLTMDGFEVYMFEHDICRDFGDYVTNSTGAYNDFSAIITYIRRQIRQDQISGGMAGIYNHTLTARLNGLVEKTETKGDIKQEIVVKFEDEANNNSPTETP